MLVNTWIRTVVSVLITVPNAWFRTGTEIVRIPSKGRKAKNSGSSIQILRRSNSFNLEDRRTINHRALGKRTTVTSDMKEDDNDWKNWVSTEICGTFFACSDEWGGLGKALTQIILHVSTPPQWSFRLKFHCVNKWHMFPREANIR